MNHTDWVGRIAPGSVGLGIVLAAPLPSSVRKPVLDEIDGVFYVSAVVQRWIQVDQRSTAFLLAGSGASP